MIHGTPATPLADSARPLPATPAGRQDAIAAALVSLAGEERRLARLGFEPALARCRAQVRFWRFLEALHSIPRDPRPSRAARETFRWRPARAR